MYREVFFDTETEKLFNEISTDDPSRLGLSIVSCYVRELDLHFQEREGKLLSFWVSELDGLWNLLQRANRVIGFNSLRFDVPVLQPYAPFPLISLAHFDIFDKVKNVLGRRASLNALAQDTLGRSKSDSGRNAVLK